MKVVDGLFRVVLQRTYRVDEARDIVVLTCSRVHVKYGSIAHAEGISDTVELTDDRMHDRMLLTFSG